MKMFSFFAVFILLFHFSALAQPANNAKNVCETIREFARVLISDQQELPLDFTLKVDEQRLLLRASGKGFSDDEVLRKFKKYQEYTSEKFADFKKHKFVLEEYISFDSVKYESRNMPYVSVLMIFKGNRKRESLSDSKSDTIRISTSFVVLNNKLKIKGSIFPPPFFLMI